MDFGPEHANLRCLDSDLSQSDCGENRLVYHNIQLAHTCCTYVVGSGVRIAIRRHATMPHAYVSLVR